LPVTTTSHKQGTTMRWAAPEILNGETKRSFPADIYALGMTILEIMTGAFPFANLETSQIYGAVVHRGKIPDRPKAHIPLTLVGNMFWTVLTSCWSREIQNRPSAAEVSEQMQMFTPEKLYGMSGGFQVTGMGSPPFEELD
ncbi:hypothetical protein RSAG8_13896, partial [Rhizoctonia solani AG-8 WAC10335]